MNFCINCNIASAFHCNIVRAAAATCPVRHASQSLPYFHACTARIMQLVFHGQQTPCAVCRATGGHVLYLSYLHCELCYQHTLHGLSQYFIDRC